VELFGKNPEKRKISELLYNLPGRLLNY